MKLLYFPRARLIGLLAVLFATLAVGPVGARADDRASAKATAQDSGQNKDTSLDQLFDALRVASTPLEIETIEMRIATSLQKTDSDTIGLLMQRGRQAVRQGDLDRALDHFTWVVELAPDYVDGWYSRALVYRAMDRLSEAVADIEWVVSLEPRHFQAWTKLGEIFMDIGNEPGAYNAYKFALDVNPHLEEAGRAVRALAPVVDGRGI